MSGSGVASAGAAATGQWWLPLATEGIKAFAGSAGNGPAAPSRSDTGGMFGFDNSNWVVNTGAGSAALTPSSNALLWVAVAAGAVLLVWKLSTKKH